MARTIRVKVYKFNELSNEAKQKAINEARRNVDTSFIYDDAHETVKAFHNVFGTKEGGRSWLDANTGHIDDNIMNLKGLRLRTYVINNFWSELYKGKYYNYKSNTPTQLIHKRIKSKFYTNSNSWGNYYYSGVTFEHSCVLTGVCYDEDILQPVYDLIERYNEKKDYYSYMDFETLINDCFSSLEKSVEDEEDANYTDEAITESLENNDDEYTKDGERY